MQQIQHEPENIKGIEVLNFDQVELEKIRLDGTQSFHTTGTLNVVYFDYYGHFILQLNNWRYALLSRLPVASNQPLIYTMPAYDGTYILKLNNNASPAALQNFEEVLRHTTGLSDTVNDEGIKGGLDYIGRQEGLEFHGESIGGSVQPLRKRDMIKKEVQKMADKVYYKYWDSKNPNFTEVRSFETIKATPEGAAPSYDFNREEIEITIVSARDIRKKIEHPSGPIKEKITDLVEKVKEGAQDLKAKITGGDNQGIILSDQKPGMMSQLKEGIQEVKAKLTTQTQVGRETPMKEIFVNETYQAPEIHRSSEKPKIFDQINHNHELHSTLHHVNPVERGIQLRQEEFFQIGGSQPLRGAQHEANRYSGSINVTGQYYDQQPRPNLDQPNVHEDMAGKVINFIGDKVGTHGSGEVVGVPPENHYHPTLLEKVKTKIPFFGGDDHKEFKENHPSPVKKRELLKAALPVLLSQFTHGQTQTDEIKFTDVFKVLTMKNHEQKTGTHNQEASQKPGVVDKVKAGIPFLHETPISYGREVEPQPQPSLIDKVKAKLPFMNQEQIHNIHADHVEAQHHPTFMEKVKAGLICGSTRQHSDQTTEVRNIYQRVGDMQPIIMDKIKAAMPFGHNQEAHNLGGDIHETRDAYHLEGHNPTFVEKVRARIPGIVDQIESKLHKKKTEISTQTDDIQVVDLVGFSEYQTERAVEVETHHRRPIFESINNKENIPPPVEIESYRKALEPIEVTKSEAHHQNTSTNYENQHQSTGFEGQPAQIVKPDGSLQNIPPVYERYDTPAFDQTKVQAEVFEQNSGINPQYMTTTPAFEETYKTGSNITGTGATTIGQISSYDSRSYLGGDSLNGNSLIKDQEYRSAGYETNIVSQQPIVQVTTTETREIYTDSQPNYSHVAPEGEVVTNHYSEQPDSNLLQGVYTSNPSIINKRTLQSGIISRGPRREQDLLDIQSRINRSDVIARSPRTEKLNNKAFETFEHYQA